MSSLAPFTLSHYQTQLPRWQRVWRCRGVLQGCARCSQHLPNGTPIRNAHVCARCGRRIPWWRWRCMTHFSLRSPLFCWISTAGMSVLHSLPCIVVVFMYWFTSVCCRVFLLAPLLCGLSVCTELCLSAGACCFPLLFLESRTLISPLSHPLGCAWTLRVSCGAKNNPVTRGRFN